ncbi:hypothetical protein N752_14205 [Desulforamulus aquiferis]|nr:hypothetical protein [Desulforamulus aquiferis]RYD04522.1 hypothetical protein N752_14205 [Desulforamulus aquiferis]
MCQRSLGEECQTSKSPWQPWEIILRLLTIGYRLPDIAQKTGYPEVYLELFRKQYYRLQEIVDSGISSEEQLLARRELAGIDVKLIPFMVDFVIALIYLKTTTNDFKQNKLLWMPILRWSLMS